ncbi:MAG: M42 family metallopeptidase [Clostridiales bacterium]|nr:M42 family metallopeptidase [Clostridiales bacterium]
MKDFLMEIAGVFGPAGDEGLIREYITEKIKDIADEIRVDAMGNLIALKKGSGEGKRVMVAAHMDSIGIMVTNVEKEGYLRFATIGGVNPQVLVNQKVMFKNGIIGVVTSEDKNASSLYIDIGAIDDADAKNMVSFGDYGVYYAPSAELANDVIASPYMDNRVSCLVAIEALKRMKNVKHDVYFVFTTQEEVGLRGAKAAAYSVMPDIGIAVDVTGTGDNLSTNKHMAVRMGAGAAIKIKDGSVLCHPKVKAMIENIARENEIPYQLEILEYGGTDTSAIQLTGAGIPAGAISIPARYIHSMSETVSLSDVEACITLLTKTLESDMVL